MEDEQQHLFQEPLPLQQHIGTLHFQDALLFQSLDTPPAGSARRTDFVGQIRMADGRILLEGGKNFSVNEVHAVTLFRFPNIN